MTTKLNLLEVAKEFDMMHSNLISVASAWVYSLQTSVTNSDGNLTRGSHIRPKEPLPDGDYSLTLQMKTATCQAYGSLVDIFNDPTKVSPVVDLVFHIADDGYLGLVEGEVTKEIAIQKMFDLAKILLSRTDTMGMGGFYYTLTQKIKDMEFESVVFKHYYRSESDAIPDGIDTRKFAFGMGIGSETLPNSGLNLNSDDNNFGMSFLIDGFYQLPSNAE